MIPETTMLLPAPSSRNPSLGVRMVPENHNVASFARKAGEGAQESVFPRFRNPLSRASDDFLNTDAVLLLKKPTRERKEAFCAKFPRLEFRG